MKRQTNATLILPFFTAKAASFFIPDEFPSDEYSSSKPLKSSALVMHSSATSNYKGDSDKYEVQNIRVLHSDFCSLAQD